MNNAKPPALAYAEDVLGVHNVYEEVQGAQLELDEALTALDKAQDERRDFDHQIEDYEMNVLISERGKHGDMSEAGMTRHLKEVLFKDTDLKILKQKRNSKAGECSGIELDITYAKHRIQILTARMIELGGYFNYLAVTKQAALAEQTNQTTVPQE